MPTIHSGPRQVIPHDAVRLVSGMRDATRNLPRFNAGVQEGKHGRAFIARLSFKASPINSPAIETRRRSGLQAANGQRQFCQLRCQLARRRIAHSAARHPCIANVDNAVQERPRRQDHMGRGKQIARRENDAADLAVSYLKCGNFPFDNRQARDCGQFGLQRFTIQASVDLCARALNSRTLATIQKSELNTGTVGHPSHQPIQSVNFPDEVAFAQPADGWVAGHGADRFGAQCNQSRGCAHPGCDRRSLSPGVTAANHDDIVVFHVEHPLLANAEACKNLAQKVINVHAPD